MCGFFLQSKNVRRLKAVSWCFHGSFGKRRLFCSLLMPLIRVNSGIESYKGFMGTQPCKMQVLKEGRDSRKRGKRVGLL